MHKNNNLTPRELKTLKLAAYSNHEIALHLGISYQTVRNHWRAIYDKFQISGSGHKRIKAVLIALKSRTATIDDFISGIGY